MPRNGSGVYSADWVNASPNTTIESAKQNAMVADLVADANAARPITAGGTGRTVARLLDGTWRFENTADPTKLLAYDLSGLTTATTRTQAVPDENGRQALAPHLAGHLWGLTLSNNVTDATNDIDIAVGNAIDSTNTHVMTLAGALTKRLDAAWAVGTGNGGRMSAAAIADTSYHVFLIKRADTGVVDIGFDTSPTAPTLPTNYTLFRRIGSIVRASGAIVSFKQFGNEFTLDVPTFVDSGADPGVAASLVTLPNVPGGIRVSATLAYYVFDSSAANYTYLLISDPASLAVTVTDERFTVSTPSNTGNVVGSGRSNFRTNGSAQVRARLSFSDAGVRYRIVALGWVDDLGRQL